MKKLLGLIVIVIIFSSCGTTYHGMSGGSSGCGVWFPKKFERDRSWERMKIRSNPNSAYNRHGRGW
jgi:hypothetical protein